MASLTLDLKPGSGLGPFHLGMPICDAFAHLDQNPDNFDEIQIKYHDEEPLMCDLLIAFPNHGFHLRFEPVSQRLRLIEVFDVQRLQMRYAASLIGGTNMAATFVVVYAIFGPTFPGKYNMDQYMDGCTYTLFYPGLSFAFPIPMKYAASQEAELPLEFPDGTTPVLSRVCIYDKRSDGAGVGVGVGTTLNKAVLPQLPFGSLYLEEVHVKLGKGLSFAVGCQHMPFGASPQDVWAELGRPCGIHKKQTNRIKKFILHTNFPGHRDFTVYIKCNFIIHCASAASDKVVVSGDSSNRILPETKWDQVKELLGDCGRAAIQSQGYSRNPFGPTLVYGYRNVAFEVMKNGQIATVTLFQSTIS